MIGDGPFRHPPTAAKLPAAHRPPPAGPTTSSWYDSHAGPLVRPYTITGGRTRPHREDLALITLVVARDPRQGTARMRPEPAAILEMCREQPLAVAEIAGHLDLPISVVKVLLGDLIEDALILTRAPVAVETPDVRIIQRVIEGVRRL